MTNRSPPITRLTIQRDGDHNIDSLFAPAIAVALPLEALLAALAAELADSMLAVELDAAADASATKAEVNSAVP